MYAYVGADGGTGGGFEVTPSGRYGAAKMEELTQSQKISERSSLGVRKRGVQ
jgi:hypothetical protein